MPHIKIKNKAGKELAIINDEQSLTQISEDWKTSQEIKEAKETEEETQKTDE